MQHETVILVLCTVVLLWYTHSGKSTTENHEEEQAENSEEEGQADFVSFPVILVRGCFKIIPLYYGFLATRGIYNSSFLLVAVIVMVTDRLLSYLYIDVTALLLRIVGLLVPLKELTAILIALMISLICSVTTKNINVSCVAAVLTYAVLCYHNGEALENFMKSVTRV